MALKQLMTEEVTSLPVSATVADAAKFMTDMNVGTVVVMEGDKAVGILTDRDIMTKLIALGKDPSKAKVAEIMTSPVATVASDKDIFDATSMMRQHKVRRLPVTENGKVVGFIALDDILMFLGGEMEDVAAVLKAELGK
jgi:signal-transduction protein with cAMP-binding, CBS, and nucleotidyltransferase domain